MTEETYKNYDDTAGFRAGYKVVLERLFKNHYSSLKSYARLIIKDAIIAEDIVQEVFLRLLENSSIIIIESTAKAYLFRAVHNQCINHLKTIQANASISEEAISEMRYHTGLVTHDFDNDILEKLASAELLEYVNKEIDHLPPQCREVFLLNRQADLTYNQISEKLGISYNTVKTQIMRALDRLRESLKKF